MKKKIMECSIHGETLFRCKRRVWNKSTSKETKYADEYTEKCFKCINEGRYKPKIIQKKQTHKYLSLKD